MGQDWIIDVLADLRAFAIANKLPRLSAQLERTLQTARAELRGGGSQPVVPAPKEQSRPADHG